MLGEWDACARAARQAIDTDPLSPFVRAISALGMLSLNHPGANAEAALALHNEALALDPNSVVNLWASAVRLGELGCLDDALRRMSRAVELTQRGPLIVGMLGRLLALAGRRSEALALRAELDARQRTEYIGPAAVLPIDGVTADEETLAATLQRCIEAGSGVPSISASGSSRELDRLLDHPRLGPLVGQFSLYSHRARLSVTPPSPAAEGRVVTPL